MTTARVTVPMLAAVALLAVGCGGGTEEVAVEDQLAASVSPVEEDQSDEPSPTPTPSEDPEADESPAADDPSPSATDEEPTASDEPTASPVDPAEVCTVAADEARIEVVAPAPGDVVGETFRLAGCGNTFEATYLWEVELADGTIAASDFGTMTCGSGCVGTFDTEVTVEGSGEAVLRVFEESAQDGSRVNVVEVPITIG